jgi:hypothetical protein
MTDQEYIDNLTKLTNEEIAYELTTKMIDWGDSYYSDLTEALSREAASRLRQGGIVK